jgi:hypothetical protein
VEQRADRKRARVNSAGEFLRVFSGRHNCSGKTLVIPGAESIRLLGSNYRPLTEKNPSRSSCSVNDKSTKLAGFAPTASLPNPFNSPLNAVDVDIDVRLQLLDAVDLVNFG